MSKASVLIVTRIAAAHQAKQNNSRHQRYKHSANRKVINNHNDLRTTACLTISSCPQKNQIFSTRRAYGRPAQVRSEPIQQAAPIPM